MSGTDLSRHARRGAFILTALGSACALINADHSSTQPEGSNQPIACTRSAVVEDGENNDHQVIVHAERNGYIYTFRGGDTQVEPTPGADGGVFTMSLGGANGSQYAARMLGTVGGQEGAFAGLGFNFTEPQAGFDASKYEGISFFARRAADSSGRVRLKIPDRATSPDGGECTECFNDFGVDLELGVEWQHYVFRFEELQQLAGWGSPRPASVEAAALFGIQFQVMEAGATFDIWIDDLAFVGCAGESPQGEVAPITDVSEPAIDGDHDLIRNARFDQGALAPWVLTLGPKAAASVEIDEGRACVDIESPGDRISDVQLRHRVRLENSHVYLSDFVARSSEPTPVRARVGSAGPPYVDYWASSAEIGTTDQRFVGQFEKPNDGARLVELSLQLGGSAARVGSRVCFDRISLSDPQFTPPPPPISERAPRVRINQVGYVPNHKKLAVLATADKQPIAWALRRENGSVVADGKTRVHGEDPASGEFLHHIDFSAVADVGEGYTIAVGDQVSPPFAIGGGLYQTLRSDALAYFYHNRSGIPIELPHAGHERWVRGAGHPNDAKAACRAGSGCQYTLDASGGWYDAGDHGKYVVNAGISVWTLLNLWERADAKARARMGDGTLHIPEGGNGVPDLLDEARWELEWMLRMQVPAGKPHAGLAHHKIHEDKWTGLPHDPAIEAAPRYLHRPSTAAGLNLAATAAQAARVWRELDPAFAKRCLAAAERAYAAALAEPELFAPSDDNIGGGPYDDKDLSDEFYWAAAELFVTTGKPDYAKALKASKQFGRVQGPNASGEGAQASMSWQQVGTLGTLTLAMVPNELGDKGVDAAREAVVDAAKGYLHHVAAEGYPVPLTAGGAGKYPWGSNSLVLNNMVILGLAHQITGDSVYLEGMLQGMDYLLGRNPNSQSYVSGYGSYPLLNPHHRHWGAQLDPAFPGPPPGAISGGPNSDLQDPYVQQAGLPGCPPMKCFVDHIESWSTNEVAINWNAPFAWVAAYVDDQVRP
ncbi:glycoside hydrolase family 9 protein [Enhygromyxa salina]|uniref:Endoglucanase n=1 Tax=Enhygromyxa salina TaxID=215803 RepID=A0A2S9Y0C7_9BACT|nr:glycoside hydrolase family 9 protein [Enhygromyxa salina]PRP98578.1 Cellulose 1,4-beta-cellobiosidase precursor [Enhygromyxa salina]